MVGSWQGGFQANVTVTNNAAAAINGWTVSWTLPSGQTVSQVWSGTLSTSGSTVSVRNAAWNGALAAGAGTTFGFIGTGAAGATPALTCTTQ